MKKIFLAAMIFVASTAVTSFEAKAADSEFGLTGGFRTNNIDTDVAGASVSGQNGFQVGGLAWFHFADPLSLRTGFVYSQRYFQAKTSTSTVDVKFTYLDIPLTLQYKFGDYGGVFFGPVFMMNQSKECTSPGSSGNVCTGIASSLTPLSVGVSFKFAPQMGAELAYEFYSGKVADGFTNLRSLGANFVYFFD